MAGFVVILWAAPVMTAGHLLLAAAATGYILVGIAFEEHDRIRSPGDAFAAYRARAPALVPGPRSGVIRPGLTEEKKNDSLGSRRHETQNGHHPGGGTSAASRPHGRARPGGHARAVAVDRGRDRGRRAGGRSVAGPRPKGRPVVLRDGSAVLIRPVRSTDAPLLADGFAQFSAHRGRCGSWA
jgi:hypothetical protein